MKRQQIEAIQAVGKIKRSHMLKAEELIASCDHKKEKRGEVVSTLRPIGKDGEQLYKCSICNAKVDLSEVSNEEIEASIETIKNVINSIKVVSDDMSDDLLEQLGATILILDKLPKAYDAIVVDTLHEDERSFNTNFTQGPGQFQQMGNMDPRFTTFMHNPIMASYGGKKNKHKKHNGGKKKKKQNRGFDW